MDRCHQDRIVSLKQEISVISETLALQRKVLSLAQPGVGVSRVVARGDIEPRERSRSRSRRIAAYNGDEYLPVLATTTGGSYLQAAAGSPYSEAPAGGTYLQASPGNDLQPPTIDPSGVQGLLVQDSLALVDKRIREFREMRDRASDLGDWVISYMISQLGRR